MRIVKKGLFHPTLGQVARGHSRTMKHMVPLVTPESQSHFSMGIMMQSLCVNGCAIMYKKHGKKMESLSTKDNEKDAVWNQAIDAFEQGAFQYSR